MKDNYHFWYSEPNFQEGIGRLAVMANGLDIGTGALRAARDGTDGPVIDTEPPVVLSADGADLEAAGVSVDDARTVEAGGSTYLVGSDAERVAAELDVDPDPLFSRGVLTVEPYAEPGFSTLVSDLLDDGTGERLCYTTPGTLVDGDEATAVHRTTIDTVLDDRGYDATPISKGFAVVYDQLAEDKYTGLGICIESDVTSVSLSYYGVPVLAFSLSKGGDWIVDRAASDGDHDPSAVASAFETFALDPDAATGGIESALARAHDALAEELVEAFATESEATELDRGIAVPVAVAGTHAVDGVEFLLGGRLDAADLPFSIRGVRLADDPAECPARGALTAAAADVDAYEEVTWSERVRSGTDDGDARDVSSGSAQLQVDERDLEEPADTSGADEAIDRLFDRLATRDEEVERVAENLADLEERTATRDAVDAVETRLANDHETLADDVATLRATVDDLSVDVDRLAESAIDREELDESVERLESSVDADIAELRDELSTAVETTTTIEERIDALSDRLDEHVAESASVDDLDAARGDLSDDLDSLASRVDDLESTLDAFESEEVPTDVDAVDPATLAAVADELRGDLASLTDRLDDLEERTAESDEDSTDVEDERIAELRDELDSIRDELEDGTSTGAAWPRRGVVLSLLAGVGGGAAAAGGTIALASDPQLGAGAAVAGLGLLATGVAVTR